MHCTFWIDQVRPKTNFCHRKVSVFWDAIYRIWEQSSLAPGSQDPTQLLYPVNSKYSKETCLECPNLGGNWYYQSQTNYCQLLPWRLTFLLLFRWSSSMWVIVWTMRRWGTRQRPKHWQVWWTLDAACIVSISCTVLQIEETSNDWVSRDLWSQADYHRCFFLTSN